MYSNLKSIFLTTLIAAASTGPALADVSFQIGIPGVNVQTYTAEQNCPPFARDNCFSENYYFYGPTVRRQTSSMVLGWGYAGYGYYHQAPNMRYERGRVRTWNGYGTQGYHGKYNSHSGWDRDEQHRHTYWRQQNNQQQINQQHWKMERNQQTTPNIMNQQRKIELQNDEASRSGGR